MRPHKTTVRLLVCVLFYAASCLYQQGPAFADFSGPVVRVLDNDTLEVLHTQHPERIRLSGIDCPEKGQPFGQKAKQAGSALVFGKDVTLQTHCKDKYGRSTTKPSGCWGWCLSGWGNVLGFTAPS